MTANDDAPASVRASVLQDAGRAPAPIPYVRDMDPRYGEAVEVAPGLRRLTCRNPGPFTFLGTNQLHRRPEREGGRGGGGRSRPARRRAPRRPAPRRGGRAGRGGVRHPHARRPQPAGAPLRRGGGRPRPCTACPTRRRTAARSPATPPSAPTSPSRTGGVVAGEGWALEAMFTPGHASNHMAYALGGDVLLAGDHVMGWSTTIVSPPDGDMDAYLASLDRVIARGFRTLPPGARAGGDRPRAVPRRLPRPPPAPRGAGARRGGSWPRPHPGDGWPPSTPRWTRACTRPRRARWRRT